MNRHRAADQIPLPCPADDRPGPEWARWVRERWEAVRVTNLETVARRADIPGRVRVRVNVHLGALAPADVVVEATADGAEMNDATSASPIRLWSTQSYGNGTYVFEGLLPPQSGEQGRPLAVRVRPGAAHEALSTLEDVERAFEIAADPARALDDAGRARSKPAAVTG